MLESKKLSPNILQCLCRTFILRVNTGNQKLESPLNHKQEVANTLRGMEIAFYIQTFFVLILHLYFNFSLNSFSIIIRHMTVTESIYIFTIYQHTGCSLCLSNISPLIGNRNL
jgi:hypothetical protein